MSVQQDFDQNKLEEEMRKRKERVEKWREEQRKKAIENIGEIKKELEEMKQGKKWSLEDDDGEQTLFNNHLQYFGLNPFHLPTEVFINRFIL